MLQRVACGKKATYREIIQKYINYVQSHNEKSSIVFNEYQDGLSTKDHEHVQKTVKSKKSLDISLHLENSIGDISQQGFLANSNNKQCFIELLMRVLPCNGYQVLQCRDDANTSIVSTILNFVCAGENVCLVAAKNRFSNNADLYVQQ